MKPIKTTEVPSDAQLIDVREPDEFSIIHAKNAVNIPLSELTTRHQEIDQQRDIYLICQSGGRSTQACEYLENALGWDPERIINVEGGTGAWLDAGLPTS
ncbi:rhodanese-like domain-containing protein [Corynebacterium mayonis]|uniref:rhodanese-like domain-containing protein n=1 Tax=Corynebacterium mayonis TaxID=3062461 RepID=UPI00314019F4